MKKAILFIILLSSLLIQIKLIGQNASLSFNGFSDYAEVTDFQNVDLQTNEFTLEAWVRGESALNPGHSTIFSNRVGQGGASNTNGVMFGFHNEWGGSQYKMLGIQLDGINYVLINNGSYNGDILDGNCHHVAISRENDSLLFYVDGVLIGERMILDDPVVDLNPIIWIGNDPVIPTSRFNGEISEIRIWNDVRTDSEIANNMTIDLPGNTADFAAYWRLDEGAGQIINDQVGNTSGTLGESLDEEFIDPVWLGASICDLSFDCPGIVLIDVINICGTYEFEIADGVESADITWDFGDGEIIENGSVSETHEYVPGFYSGIVTYSSEECTFISIPFFVNVWDCEAPCEFEIGYEEPWCENYYFGMYTTIPSDFYTIEWYLNGQFVSDNYYFEYSFLEEGPYSLCAIVYSANCTDGFEMCEIIDVSFENCDDYCPTEVFVLPYDQCGLFEIFTEGGNPEAENYFWDFGDGTMADGAGASVTHEYEPGVYYGSLHYYYETSICGEIDIPFEVIVEDCGECEDNQISFNWSITNIGNNPEYFWGLYEVTFPDNALEYIAGDDYLAEGVFNPFEYEHCLGNGCYALDVYSLAGYEDFDIELSLIENGIEIPYTSYTDGNMFYFSAGTGSCFLDEPCDLDFEYEVLDNGTYLFTALTNSTEEVFWNFGNGDVGTGSPIEYIYEESGDYEVWISFASDYLCETSSPSQIITVEIEEECTDVTIIIEHDLDGDIVEDLEFSLLFPNLEFDNQTLALFGQLGILSMDYCLETGCYELGISPSDPNNDISTLEVTILIDGNLIATSEYDEDNNSVGLTFGVNDASCIFTSIEENGFGNISIYPNPTQNELTIDLAENTQSVNYMFVDILGQIVQTGTLKNTLNTIQTNQLAEGQYNLVLNNGKLIQTKRVSIVR